MRLTCLVGSPRPVRSSRGGITRIEVLVIAAGPTETEHFDVLLEGSAKLPWGDPPRQPPDEVARTIVRAIEQGRHEIVTGWRGRALLLLNRIAPRLLDRFMSRYG